jgi:tRNA A-37 threonylcarbamoyl transferase component Bud32
MASGPPSDDDPEAFDDPLGLAEIKPHGDEPDGLDDQRMLGRLQSSLFDMEPEVQRLGRWIVLETLGEGAMGVVYAAYDPRLDRRVALKALQRDRIQNDDAKARMLREAQGLARISDHHVVQVHDVEEIDGQVYLVMELIDGPTLRKWLEAPRVRSEVLDCYTQLAHGLARIHAAGLVHRDVKPDNVLVAKDRVVITDFGLVNATADAAAEHEAIRGLEPTALAVPLTSRGAVLGTKGYMAPEQHRGHGTDARSDQFSFWVCLYEALFGELPFHGRTAVALDAQVAAGPSMRPANGPLAPAWILPLLRRGLSLDPAHRFPSMEDVEIALRRGQRRRKRIQTLAGIGFGIGVAAFGMAVAMTRDDPCASAIEQIEPFWGDSRRAALQARIEGDGTTNQPRAWQDLEQMFELQAQRWGAAWMQDCKAQARGSADRTEERLLSTSRSMCVSRNRLELTAFSERLMTQATTPSPANVQSVVVALASMPDCGDAATLMRFRDDLTEAPEPPGAEALWEALARAHADETLGQYAEAEQEAAAVVEDARKLGLPRVIPMALYRQARITANRGETQAARMLALEATELSASSRNVALAAEAWVFLAKLSANDLRDAALTKQDLAVAHHAVLEAGEDVHQAWLYADYLEARGMGAFLERHYADAEEFHREALALRLRLLPGSDRRIDIVKSKNNLANVLSRLGSERKIEALATYEEALHDAETLLGADHPFNAELWFNIGIQQRDAGRTGEATDAFRRAAQLDHSARGEAGAPALRAYLALGDSTEDEAERKMIVGRIEAIHAHLIGEDPAAMQHPERAQELKLIARVRLVEGDVAAAIDVLERAAAVQQPIEEIEHAWTLVDLAGVLVGAGRRAEAVPLLEQALASLRRDHDPADETYLSEAEALLVELKGGA